MLEFIKKMLGIETVDVKDLLVKGAVVLDVRTVSEYRSGHPKGAFNIPLPEINKNLTKIKKYNKPIVTCCASGRRSGIAAQQLKNAGIEAYNGGPWTRVANAKKG